MKLQIKRSGIWYGSFKFGFWEYFAYLVVGIFWYFVLFSNMKICMH